MRARRTRDVQMGGLRTAVGCCCFSVPKPFSADSCPFARVASFRILYSKRNVQSCGRNAMQIRTRQGPLSPRIYKPAALSIRMLVITRWGFTTVKMKTIPLETMPSLGAVNLHKTPLHISYKLSRALLNRELRPSHSRPKVVSLPDQSFYSSLLLSNVYSVYSCYSCCQSTRKPAEMRAGISCHLSLTHSVLFEVTPGPLTAR